MKVLHVITGLDTGGAEIMLARLIAALRSRVEASVVSLSRVGVVGERLRDEGIPVLPLDLRTSFGAPAALRKLTSHVRAFRPDVVQTWMYHADLLGSLAARMAGNVPSCWCIQGSALDAAHTSLRTRAVIRVCARLSSALPERIVSCAVASRDVHVRLGYDASKFVVIPNGVDVSAFDVNPEARSSVRAELGVPEETFLIGLVGRFDPQKDHRTFVEAATLVAKDTVDVHFMLCGKDVTWDNAALVQQIDASGYRSRFHLLGLRHDTARLQASLDVMSLSSAYGEGFPLALGEAMACGVPCVATDVGDSRLIVDGAGRVVPPKSPARLAEAWREMFKLGASGRRSLGALARARIVDQFSLERSAAMYVETWTAAMNRGRAKAGYGMKVRDDA